MRFDKLTAKNFMRLGEVELDLADRGLVLVTGENLDAPKASSNGAGKSSILDAFCWALWARTIRGHSDDAVVNRQAKKDCQVSVEFEDSGVSYKVVRYRKMSNRKKPNDVELFIDGVLYDGASMAATDRHIENIVGLGFTTFQSMMPGAGVKAAELTDAKVKELLESLLQMDVVSTAQDIAKERLKKVSLQKVNVESMLQRAEEKISESEELIAQYKEKLSTFEETKLSKIESLQGQLRDKKELVTSLEKEREELSDLNVRIGRLEAKKERAKSARGKISLDFSKALDTSDSTIRTLDLKLLEVHSQLGELLDLQEGGEGTCSQCKQDITSAHLAGFDSQIKDLRAKKELIENQTRAARKSKLDISEEYSTLLRNDDLAIQEIQSKLDNLTSKKRTIEKHIYSLGFVENQVKDLEARLNTVREESSPFEGFIESQEEKRKAAQKEKKKQEKQLTDLSDQEEMLKFWVEGFGIRGLRSLMLSHVTPVLNERAKHYCDLLTDGEMSVEFSTKTKLKSGKKKEQFSINVSNKHGDSSYTGSSAGERSRADLVIAFALGDLAHMRARKRVPFRFLDEPFENIDEAGHESIVQLLAKQEEDYGSIFCITHKLSLQAMFENRIKVVKEDGVSRIEVDND